MSRFQISNYKNNNNNNNSNQEIEYSMNNYSEILDTNSLSLKTEFEHKIISKNINFINSNLTILIGELNNVFDDVDSKFKNKKVNENFGSQDENILFNKVVDIIEKIDNYKVNKTIALLNEVLKYDIDDYYKVKINEVKLKLVLYNSDQAKAILQSLYGTSTLKSKQTSIMDGEKTKKLKIIKSEILLDMVNLLEKKDIDTSQHVRRTSRYVEILTDVIKTNEKYMDICTPEYIENLVLAALLHDIGKSIIPKEILCKPTKLTEEEFEIMKTHTVIGSESMLKCFDGILDDLFLNIVCDISLYHHEKWDGSGYPKGLSGENIPLCARIMAIADVFDALSAKRSYKDEIPIDTVFTLMEEWRGSHFDPNLLDAFLSQRNLIKTIMESFKRY